MADTIKTPQDFYNENRDLFKAETSAVEIDKLTQKCDHFFYRPQFSRVECKKCHMGYIDNNRMIIKNGKIEAIK